jgi:hypothetical protein
VDSDELTTANQSRQTASAPLVLTVGTATITEGGSFALPVTLSAPVLVDLTFGFATSSGSAVKGGGGVAQNDFGTTGTVTIPAGQTTASIPITTIDDGVFEGTETFFVNVVSNFPSLATFAAPQALITIVDDEPRPTLAVTNVTLTDPVATFTVNLSGPTDVDVIVTLKTRPGTVTGGGTGTTTLLGTAVIPAGQTSATFDVNIGGVTKKGDTVVLEGPGDFLFDSNAGQQTSTNIALLTGRGKRSVAAALGTDDGSSANNLALPLVVGSADNLQATVSSGSYVLPAPTTPGATFNFAGGTTPFGTVSGEAFLSLDSQFVFYGLLEPGGNRQFLFAGIPSVGVPTTGRNRFALKSDFVLNSNIPFIPNALGGSLAPTSPTHAYIDWDTSGGGVQRPFGGGVIFISGQGANQKSAASIFTGQVLLDGSGKPHIQGEMRGQSRISNTGRANFFESDVSSGDAGDGSDFFGSGPDHFVLEASTVSATDTLLARTGVEQTVAGTTTTGIFPNVPAVDDPPPLGTQSTRTLTGFVGGLVREFDTPQTTPIEASANNAVSITTSAALNTVDASFDFEADLDKFYEMDFGGGNAAGQSFFFDNDTFGAIERSIDIDTGAFTISEAKFAMITASALDHTGLLPSGVAFCTCSFLEWGFWGADIRITAPAADRREIDLATWVAGDVTSLGALVGFGTPTSAQYTGHAITAVNNGGSRYTAVGEIILDFTFSSANFDLDKVTINKLDGVDFTSAKGTSFVPSTTNAYNSTAADLTITGGGRTATLRGKFFGTASPPQETGGVINVTGTGYDASGTYAAAQ